jgi:hypothetical protein
LRLIVDEPRAPRSRARASPIQDDAKGPDLELSRQVPVDLEANADLKEGGGRPRHCSFSLKFLNGRKIEWRRPPRKHPRIDRDLPRLIKVNSFAPICLTFGGGPTYETVGICLLGAVHTFYACATWQIIDFPPTLPVTIVHECAFAFLLHRSYSQQPRPSLRQSRLGHRHLTDQLSSWSKDLSLQSTKTSLPPRPRLYLQPLLP